MLYFLILKSEVVPSLDQSFSPDDIIFQRKNNFKNYYGTHKVWSQCYSKKDLEF